MKLFWSVTLYDVDTRSLLVNKQRIADKSSRMDLKKNADGSVDIYCGPKAPKGFEANWIPTVAGRNWFSYFRLYEPTQPYFDRYILSGIQKVPAAIPARTKVRRSSSGKRMTSAKIEPTPTLICAVGPSRPAAPPDPIVMADAIALINGTMGLILPPLK